MKCSAEEMQPATATVPTDRVRRSAGHGAVEEPPPAVAKVSGDDFLAACKERNMDEANLYIQQGSDVNVKYAVRHSRYKTVCHLFHEPKQCCSRPGPSLHLFRSIRHFLDIHPPIRVTPHLSLPCCPSYSVCFLLLPVLLAGWTDSIDLGL
jgi:hypothetical protein